MDGQSCNNGDDFEKKKITKAKSEKYTNERKLVPKKLIKNFLDDIIFFPTFRYQAPLTQSVL